MGTRYVGQWRDSPQGALQSAMADTNIQDWVVLEYSDGYALVPVDPDLDTRVHAEVAWSEARDQYRATLIKL